LHSWFSSYLSGSTQTVRIGINKSSQIIVKSGVPQGSHLGPLLFLLFINDIIFVLRSMSVLLYADDMKLFMPIIDRNDCDRVQMDLENVCEWCEMNKLYLNISKCKVITFSRARSTEYFDYSLNGLILERVNDIRDLGVVLSFEKHID
jgi:Reverse transcriptase (RNA-dependent DNA polymerase)